MSDANLTPSPDEAPAVDEAEQVDGHPLTAGVEQMDDESIVDESDLAFGEDPDVETPTGA